MSGKSSRQRRRITPTVFPVPLPSYVTHDLLSCHLCSSGAEQNNHCPFCGSTGDNYTWLICHLELCTPAKMYTQETFGELFDGS